VTEALVFRVATAVLVVHALDDAFVHRQPGLSMGQHALAAAITVVAGVAGAVAFGSLRPGLRAALAFSFGTLALVNGVTHGRHIGLDGPAASDVTGALAGVAGVVLVGLAAAIPWRHRGEGAATRRRRWGHRAIAIPAALLGLLVVIVPISIAIVETHKWREPIGAPPSAAYRDVSFRATDGLHIAGWYRPSANGAAVLVVHGGGSDRTGGLRHAEMLAAHGYGVLVYDSRGRGESDGSPNGYGWDWGKDAGGALAFLRRQPDVKPGRIGGLGLSTGADVLLEVAAQTRAVDALVTDGAAAGSFEDGHRLNGTVVETPMAWTMFKAIQVLSGDAPGPPLEDLVPRLHAPTLMISAGTTVERDFNVLYERAAQGRVEHWNLPDADHTAAIRQERGAYERRVTAFFDKALVK
jgi:dienelactone hydrolase